MELALPYTDTHSSDHGRGAALPPLGSACSIHPWLEEPRRDIPMLGAFYSLHLAQHLSSEKSQQ